MMNTSNNTLKTLESFADNDSNILVLGPDWCVVATDSFLQVVHSDMPEFKGLTIDRKHRYPIIDYRPWREAGGEEMEKLANMARVWFLHDLANSWKSFFEELMSPRVQRQWYDKGNPLGGVYTPS